MSKKLVYGVGINDADYVVKRYITIGYTDSGKRLRKCGWACPFYNRWANMLKRCYSDKFQEKYQTYEGCTVCKDWLTFSNFKAWMETQDWEGKHLDKDILVPGNKLYGPETCVFVDGSLNSFLLERAGDRGEWAIGVYWKSGRFVARCCDGNGRQHLGRFNTEIEAHQAWLKYKQEMALQLAAEQTDPRVAKALIDRYENYVAQEKELDK